MGMPLDAGFLDTGMRRYDQRGRANGRLTVGGRASAGATYGGEALPSASSPQHTREPSRITPQV